VVSLERSFWKHDKEFIYPNEEASFEVTLLSAEGHPITQMNNLFQNVQATVTIRSFFMDTTPLNVQEFPDPQQGTCKYVYSAPQHGEVTIHVTYRENRIQEDRKIPVLRDLNKIDPNPTVIKCRVESNEAAIPFAVKVLENDILISLLDKTKIQIHRFRPSGEGENKESNGGNRYLANEFQFCRGLDLLSTGEIVLVNNQKSNFLILNKQGKPTFFGKGGTGPGEFKNPRGVVTLPNDDIAICDTDNSRVQIWTREKNDMYVFSHSIGNKNPNKKDNLLYCLGVAYCPSKKELAVTDTDHHWVQFFDLEGNSKGRIGRDSNLTFWKPSGVAYDMEGNLYVTEMGGVKGHEKEGHKLKIFDKDRKLIKELGGYGADVKHMHGPRMLTVGWDGSIVVADLENKRVLVF